MDVSANRPAAATAPTAAPTFEIRVIPLLLIGDRAPGSGVAARGPTTTAGVPRDEEVYRKKRRRPLQGRRLFFRLQALGLLAPGRRQLTGSSARPRPGPSW